MLLPMSDIAISDDLWRHPPRASEAVSRQTLEVKLTADLGVRTACVRNIVVVEWHHVRQHISCAVTVCYTQIFRLENLLTKVIGFNSIWTLT